MDRAAAASSALTEASDVVVPLKKVSEVTSEVGWEQKGQLIRNAHRCEVCGRSPSEDSCACLIRPG